MAKLSEPLQEHIRNAREAAEGSTPLMWGLALVEARKAAEVLGENLAAFVGAPAQPGEDAHTIAKRLEDAGHLPTPQAKQLSSVRGLGNKAAHPGYRATRTDVAHALAQLDKAVTWHAGRIGAASSGAPAPSPARRPPPPPSPPPPRPGADAEKQRAAELARREAERGRREQKEQQRRREEEARRRRSAAFWGWMRAGVVVLLIGLAGREVLERMDAGGQPNRRAAASQTYYVSPEPRVEEINVRTGPGGEYRRAMTLHRDAEVQVTGQAFAADGSLWRRIDWRGRTLWIKDSLLSASPPPPPEISPEQRLAGLLDEAAARGGEGFGRVAGYPDHIVGLGDDQEADWSVRLHPGVTYRIVASCGPGCHDLDLRLFDPQGRQVDTHLASDRFPVLRVSPRQSGRYTIRLVMFGCNAARCLAGARLLGAGVPRPTDTQAETRRETTAQPVRESGRGSGEDRPAAERVCRRRRDGATECRNPRTREWELQPGVIRPDWSGAPVGQPADRSVTCVLPGGLQQTMVLSVCRREGGVILE